VTPSQTKPVQDSRFTVLANGTPDSPPASGLVDYLLAHPARAVTSVFHPLTREDGNRHLTTFYEHDRRRREQVLRLPTRPPLTYPIDALIPPRLPRSDGWFAFNNLLCARGLLERRLGRTGRVVYWAVDFVPDRFGTGSPLTRAYDALDRYCCQHADVRVELSQAALEGRDARHELAPGAGARREVIPIGAWLDRVPVCPETALQTGRLVFIGHLVERMGAATAIASVTELRRRGVEVSLDIAGRGPLEGQLRADAAARGLSDHVRFHGFIADHRQLEQLLAGAAIALAPYDTRVESFTRFADPSKLKSYLAAGLPVLMTNVPPNTAELVSEGGAEAVQDDPTSFADAIERLLLGRAEWTRRRSSALTYVRRFDWGTLVPLALRAAGFEP
jgi:glycosyltransferase involved in cell wall biosynthesis